MHRWTAKCKRGRSERMEKLSRSREEKRERKCESSARHNRRNASRSLAFLPRCLPLTSTNTNFVGSLCSPLSCAPLAAPLAVCFNTIYHCRIFSRRSASKFDEGQRRSDVCRIVGKVSWIFFSLGEKIKLKIKGRENKNVNIFSNAEDLDNSCI